MVFDELVDALPAVGGKSGGPRRWPEKLHAGKNDDFDSVRIAVRALHALKQNAESLMKKLLLALSIAWCSLAHAEWTHVATASDHMVYLDNTTVKRNGNYVEGWILNNSKDVQIYNGNLYWSEKVFVEVDCKRDWIAMQYAVIMTQRMGTGEPLEVLDFSDKPSRPIAPQTVQQTLGKVLCSTK